MINTTKELREMREEIAEMLHENGWYIYRSEMVRVTMLSKEGVIISGPFSARFTVDEGFVIWNKAQRNSVGNLRSPNLRR